MKHAIFTLAILVCGLWADAQSIHRIKYDIDTLRYDGRTVLIQRSSERQLAKYANRTNADVRVASALKLMQSEFDRNIVSMKKGEGVSLDDWALREIKKAGTKFDYRRYEAELEIYKRYEADRSRAIASEGQRKKDAAAARARADRAAEAEKMAAWRSKYYAERAAERAAADSAAKIRLLAEAKADSVRELELEKYRRELAKKYGGKYADAIVSGTVLVGMSQPMAIAAWGEPEHRVVKQDGKDLIEKWNYDELTYVQFKNGVVTDFAGFTY